MVGKSGGRYTLTIFSSVGTTEQALEDFPGAQELSAHSSEESNCVARISMSNLDVIMKAIAAFVKSRNAEGGQREETEA